MKKIFEAVQEKVTGTRGATAVEYALLVGLIAVVIIVAVVALGGTLTDIFEGVASSIDTAG